MLAIGLTLALFALWAVLGYATVRATRVRLDPLQELLMAPAVGVVVLTIPLFILNRFGLPVSRFAYPLTVFLLVAAGAPLLLSRARAPWRDARPFGAILLLALLAASWPMFQFGFDWLSLCNDDMANYSLGATRFFHYGFNDAPTAPELVGADDYSQFYWFLHVPAMVRPGVELVLAWAMGVTQLSPLKAFMPLVMAFHLCQVAALGALMHASRETRGAALAGCALLAVSALATFGALYQLIAQVYGMGLIAVTAAVLMRPYDGPAAGSMVRRGVLAGILGAGLFLLYPEVIPIVGASWMLYLLGEALARRVPPKPVLTFLGCAILAVLVLLGWQAVGILGFLFTQTKGGSTGSGSDQTFFPYYRLPSGFADFWGFFPLTLVPNEPWASLGVLAGALLLAAAAVAAVWMARRRHAVAIVATVMLVLTAFLGVRQAEFGLYKIAMFLQPFVLGTVALAVFSLLRRAVVRAAVLGAVALPGLIVQQLYVFESRGTAAAGGFPEIVDPSRSKIMDDFQRLLDRHADAVKAGGVVSDTQNIVLGKFESYLTRGVPAAFPGARVGTSMMGFTEAKSWAPRAIMDQAIGIRAAVEDVHMARGAFDLHDPSDPIPNGFRYVALGPLARHTTSQPATAPATQPAPEPLLIATGPKQTVLNRWAWQSRGGAEAAEAAELNFFARPFTRVRDHLMFIESDKGRSYFLYFDPDPVISMYQMEPDPLFYRGTTMAGIGRRCMFQVLRPSPGVRLMMELTSSLAADGHNKLPTSATAIGSKRHSLGVTGRGSARVFSPPLDPQEVAGRSFIAFDMGREPVPFRQPRAGLMLLYGTRISLDRRWVVCFARNISAVSDAQYAAMTPPSRLERFPQDFQNPHLEYSGFYEDGWASDHAWCALARPWDAEAVVIKGFVPELGDAGFQTEVTVRVDGQEVARRVLGLKDFEIKAPLPAAAPGAAAVSAGKSTARVELVFSRFQQLTPPDRRPVTVMLTSLSFEGPPAPPVAVQKFPDDVHANPLLSPAGLYPDGWAAPKTTVRLTQPPGHGELALRGEVPLIGDGNFETILRVRVDGNQVADQALRVGAFDLTLPVTQGAGTSAAAPPGPRQVELEFTAAQQLPADGRAVGARLSFIGFASPPQPPARLARFPDDLKRSQVQASGIYDDGWAGPSASFRLAQPPDARTLTISGMIPKIGDADGFSTDVVVTVDGREVARRTVGLDRFTIEAPVPPAASGPTRQVGLTFSRIQSLPAPDGRSVGAKLDVAGFDASE